MVREEGEQFGAEGRVGARSVIPRPANVSELPCWSTNSNTRILKRRFSHSFPSSLQVFLFQRRNGRRNTFPRSYHRHILSNNQRIAPRAMRLTPVINHRKMNRPHE